MATYRIAQHNRRFWLIKHCGTRCVVMPPKPRLIERARCDDVGDIASLDEYERVDWTHEAERLRDEET